MRSEVRHAPLGDLGKGYRRHPAEVTSDRLAEAVERWHLQFDPAERDMVAHIRFRLEMIAEGRRG